MNKRILELTKEVTLGLLYGFLYFIEINMRYFANIVNILLPYLMYVLGQYVYMDRHEFAVGGEIFVPVLVTIFVFYSREIANRRNKGNRMPIPEKRFTEVSEDGEVNVEVSRVQVMLLYVADLEDYLHRKGML